VTLIFALKCIGVRYWEWSIFQVPWLSFRILSRYWADIVFASNATVTLQLANCFCDFELWPSDLKMYSGHLLSMTNLPNKYHHCHSWRFWEEIVFALNVFVTLTFNLLTSNLIWVIYGLWPIFLLSTMTVRAFWSTVARKPRDIFRLVLEIMERLKYCVLFLNTNFF